MKNYAIVIGPVCCIVIACFCWPVPNWIARHQLRAELMTISGTSEVQLARLKLFVRIGVNLELAIESDGRGLSATDIETLPVIHTFANRIAIRFLWMYGGTIAITIAGVVSADWLFGTTEPAIIGLVALWGAVVFFWLTSNGHDCYYRLIMCKLSCRLCGKSIRDVEKLAKSLQCPHCNANVK